MVVATETNVALMGWADLGLKANPFPGRGSESKYLKEFAQPDVFAISDRLETLQVFVGVSGVGKTVHAKLLAKHLIKSQRRPTQLITASKTIKAMGLMKMICCRFNIDMPQSEISDFQKIEHIRRAIQKRKEPLALIVDDAQNLSQDAMGALMRLTVFQQEPVRMQVVLFGMPLALDRCKKIWADLQVGHEFTQGAIKPWGASQTEAYIIAMLKESGMQTSRRVCRRVCRQVYQLSGGIPMQIQRRSSMMLGQLMQGQGKSSPEQLKGNLLWGGALLSALTVGVFCYKASIAPKPTGWQEMAVMHSEASLVAADEAESAFSLELTALDAEGEFEIDAFSEVQSEAMSEDLVALQESVDLTASEVMVEESMLEESAAEMTLVASEPAMVSSQDSEGWLQDDGYTVQVMATSAESEALKAAEGYNNARVEHVARKDKSTYVVLVGEYETLEAARDEVTSLSEQNERLSPWVRSYGQIRQDKLNLQELGE